MKEGEVTEVFRKTAYFFKQSIKSIRRRLYACVASVCIVAAVFMLMGVFVSAGINVYALTEKLGDSCIINVYIEDYAQEDIISDIKKDIIKIQGVRDVIFMSKAERLDKVTEDVYGGESIYNEENNPLRDSYIVTASDASEVQRIYNEIQDIEGVDEAVKNGDVVDGIITFTDVLHSVGVILLILFALLAVLVISGIIRLCVASYEDEIKIMKIVGATDGFILAPFIIEGVLIAVLGALISAGLTVVGYAILMQRMDYMLSGDVLAFVGTGKIAAVITPVFVMSGAVVGAVGSYISARKCLK